MAAMQAGAHEVISASMAAEDLIRRLEQLQDRHGRTISAVACADTGVQVREFIGGSEQMCVVYDQIQQFSQSDSPVFVTGEKGTGKSLCAKALHANSFRQDKPFIHFDCASDAAGDVETALFGANAASISGAQEDTIGAIERANSGILFLDEIAELDLSLQAKLLRFMQLESTRA